LSCFSSRFQESVSVRASSKQKGLKSKFCYLKILVKFILVQQ
jgi:hypothetical protein